MNNHKKRIMERMVLVPVSSNDKNSKDIFLDALFQSGEFGVRSDAVLIISGIPGFGGLRDEEFYNDLVWHLSHKGFASLRFFYRGYGASSTDRAVSIQLFIEDIQAALRQLRESVTGDISIVAYGLGCQFVQKVKIGKEFHGFNDQQIFYVMPQMNSLFSEMLSETIAQPLKIEKERELKNFCYFDSTVEDSRQVPVFCEGMHMLDWQQDSSSGYMALTKDIVDKIEMQIKEPAVENRDSNLTQIIQEFEFEGGNSEEDLELDI